MADMDFTDNHSVLPVESRKTSPTLTVPGLESTTTYSRSCVWMTFNFSGTSVYPGPSSKICCPALGDESASGAPTTGAISPLLNACPSVF
ncbi:hypothetical protein CRENBAI_020388, partial [Crenichthys baileyi]